MIIMHGNVQVTEMSSNQAHVKVLVPALMPLGLDLKDSEKETKEAVQKALEGLEINIGLQFPGAPQVGTSEFDKWLRTQKVDHILQITDKIREATAEAIAEATAGASRYNQKQFDSWLGKRVLPMARTNSKDILNNIGLGQGEDSHSKASNALRLNGVSITDNYWVKEEGSDLKWEDIDPKRVKLKEGFAVLALTGSYSHIKTWDNYEYRNVAPETSVVGTYAKGVFRKEDGDLYLLKTGPERSVYAEWIASEILKCTNVYGFVPYELDKGDGRTGFPETQVLSSVSKILTTPHLDVVAAGYVPLQAEQWALSLYKKQFAQMTVFDYLIQNGDRHLWNWGFLREAPTWKRTRLHPLFDHNKGFPVIYLTGDTNDNLSVYGRGISVARSLKKGAEELFRFSDFKFTRSVDPKIFDVFEQGYKYAEEFKRRCIEIGMGDPFNVQSSNDLLKDSLSFQ